METTEQVTRRARPNLPVWMVLSILPLVLPVARSEVHAACALIPQVEKSFPGVVGATNRPYAAPGEFLEVRLRSCDASPGIGNAASDHTVTILFDVPGSAPRAVVLAPTEDCGAIDLAGCAVDLGGGAAEAICVPASESGLEIVDHEGEPRLRFLFPDTDVFRDGVEDDVAFTGSATVVVTDATESLACDVASSGCARDRGMVACIGEVFSDDGACGMGTRDPIFGHFIALPAPNDFAEQCWSQSPPCTNVAPEARGALDTDGNVYLPFHWGGILLNNDGVPVPRLLRTSFKSPFPFVLPDEVFIASFTPGGHPLPPIFEPQIDPNAPDPSIVTLFGSADAPYTILRFARSHGTCNGGDRNGDRCAAGPDCPGGECRTSCVDDPATLCSTSLECGTGSCGELFDFSFLNLDGALVLPKPNLAPAIPGFCQSSAESCLENSGCGDNACVNYAMETLFSVSLEGIESSDDVRLFASSEYVENADQNGDGDLFDSVLTAMDRSTGARQSLGSAELCELEPSIGRAIMANFQGVHRFPAIAAEETLFAFVEPELQQGLCDLNQDGDLEDGTLSIFRFDAGEVTSGGVLTADVAPLIDGSAVVVSEQKVFIRSSMRGASPRGNSRISEMRIPEFPPREVAKKAPGPIFVGWNAPLAKAAGLEYDTTLCGNDIVEEGEECDGAAVSLCPGECSETCLCPVANCGEGPCVVESNGAVAGVVHLEGFGGFLFASEDSNLRFDGLLDDRGPCPGSERPSACMNLFEKSREGFVGPFIVPDYESPGDYRWPNDWLVAPSPDGLHAPLEIAADETELFFVSAASNLTPQGEDTNGFADLYMWPAYTMAIERISVAHDGGEPNGNTRVTTIGVSRDGRYVAYPSDATNIVLGDDNGVSDVFLRDRCLTYGEPVSDCTPHNELVSVGAGVGLGKADGSGPMGADFPRLSADGQLVAFVSEAALTEEDTHPGPDVYLHDRLKNKTFLITPRHPTADLEEEGTLPDWLHFDMSDDGRYFAVATNAPNLLPPGDDSNGVGDAFLIERFSGHIRRLSTRTDEKEVVPAGDATGVRLVSISPNGRHVAFDSDLDYRTGEVERTGRHIFVRDRDSDLLVLATVDVNGEPSVALPVGLELDVAKDIVVANSGDVIFSSSRSDLGVDPDTNELPDFYVRENRAPVSETGLADDLVLTVVDVGFEAAKRQSLVRPLCESGLASVSDGNVVFLRPETPETYGSSLGTLSCPEGVLNGDEDVDDQVVHLWTGGEVRNLGRAGVAVSISADYVAALIPEEGDQTDYNDDQDTDDFVLQIHPVESAGGWFNTGISAVHTEMVGDRAVFLEGNLSTAKAGGSDGADLELGAIEMGGSAFRTGQNALGFVAGEPSSDCGGVHLVAFHTSEAAQGVNLNAESGDADQEDLVLQVLNLVTNEVRNTGQAVKPCDIPECDPREPYGVQGKEVRFLTYEPEQNGLDLSGNGSNQDLVLQYFDFCSDVVTPIGEVDPDAGINPLKTREKSTVVIAASGRCEASVGCAASSDCGSGELCMGQSCIAGQCGGGGAACGSDFDCGICVSSIPVTCSVDTDCPEGATCEPANVAVGVAVSDLDSDGVPDDLDNCPKDYNPDQQDPDDDGVGIACDVIDVPPLSSSQGLFGRRLTLRDRGLRPNKKNLAWHARDAQVLAPEVGSADDPTVVGGRLHVVNPISGENVEFILPASNWSVLGKSRESVGYRYLDRSQSQGPCRKVTVRPGAWIRAYCEGTNIGFSLDEPNQGTLRVELQMGSQVQCSEFGGKVTRDFGALVPGQSARFTAVDAPAPVGCP